MTAGAEPRGCSEALDKTAINQERVVLRGASLLAQSGMSMLPASIAEDTAVSAAGAIPAGPGGDHPVGLGALSWDIGPDLVDEVIELSGCREQRRRLLAGAVGGVLRARVVPVQQGGQHGTAGIPVGYAVAHQRAAAPAWPETADQSGADQGRQRLGSKPLELLSERVRGPLSTAGASGAFAFGLCLVAWDGTELDVADAAANTEAVGVAQGGNPQVRPLALICAAAAAAHTAGIDRTGSPSP